ncbi:methyl-accepting chemotaxis protein [Modicisalibacter xianhensis]|uniref:Methyl-accepting chemotaxis sensory transducer with TarH sensor n=1 Tax=Modicisalibacter xianhensis TaxID=442341 RepID=A0A1I3FD63_9GAMM|nr:methyl-accepting chemotaxis protein [Halomonas xianhensis]SFI09173.1 methyl-accepting chemotaxis sensory transducer with TarH sensor [Halomonas xianhensis]
MKNWSVKSTLTAALVLLVALSAAISGLGFYANDVSGDSLDELREINVKQSNTLNRAQVNILRARVMLEMYASSAATQDDAQVQQLPVDARKALERAKERFATFETIPVGDNSRRDPYVDAIKAAYNALVIETMEPLLANPQRFEIRMAQGDLTERSVAFDNAIKDFINYAETRGQELIAKTDRTSSIIEVTGVVLLILALGAAIVLRIGLIRIVIRPLHGALAHFDKIAKGDLTGKVEDRGTNEIGQLYAGLRGMQEKLTVLVTSLRSNSDGVFTGAGEIASGSQDLSSRTEEQASALQETASSMEQMASTVRHNTDSAVEADRLSGLASQAAENGGKEVQQTVNLMRDIAASARKVNDIIEVIDSIAFQTNILALNASVEAARAGEQGRGFAVVANEVRSLASRSAASAKEIRTLIEATTTQIEAGAEQAERSGVTINETVTSIRQVSKLMSEISSATQEQNSGIEQVNVAITQMDSVTQQNASLVEQTSAAAASLEEQAQQLANLIATFRIAESGGATRPRAQALPQPQAKAPALPAKKSLKQSAIKQEEEWAEF